MTELSAEDYKSIKFIFARPHSYDIYEFSINDVERFALKNRHDLTELLCLQLGCRADRIQYLMLRGLPFLWDNIHHELKEFNEFGEPLTSQDVACMQRKEMTFNDENAENPSKQIHEQLYNNIRENNLDFTHKNSFENYFYNPYSRRK